MISLNSHGQSAINKPNNYKELTQCFGLSMYSPFQGIARGRAYYDHRSTPIQYVTMSLFGSDLKFYSFYKGLLYITPSWSGPTTHPIDAFERPEHGHFKIGNANQWRVTLNQDGKEVKEYIKLQGSVTAAQVTILGFPKDISPDPKKVATALQMMIDEVENRFLNVAKNIERRVDSWMSAGLVRALDGKNMKELKDAFCACQSAQIDPFVLKAARDEIEAKGFQKINEQGELEDIKSEELLCDFSST